MKNIEYSTSPLESPIYINFINDSLSAATNLSEGFNAY